MRVLQFTVEGQKLSMSDLDQSSIIRGSKGYLKCSFDFLDQSWSGCKIAAVFEGSDKTEFPVAVGRDNTCMVPDGVTDAASFKLRLIGVNRIGYRVTSNKVLITQGG